MKTTEATTYQKMLEEVEKIAKDVGSPTLDLDQLVTKVERGYELITQMRQRLNETKGKIEKLRTQFEASKTTDGANPA